MYMFRAPHPHPRIQRAIVQIPDLGFPAYSYCHLVAVNLQTRYGSTLTFDLLFPPSLPSSGCKGYANNS